MSFLFPKVGYTSSMDGSHFVCGNNCPIRYSIRVDWYALHAIFVKPHVEVSASCHRKEWEEFNPNTPPKRIQSKSCLVSKLDFSAGSKYKMSKVVWILSWYYKIQKVPPHKVSHVFPSQLGTVFCCGWGDHKKTVWWWRNPANQLRLVVEIL